MPCGLSCDSHLYFSEPRMDLWVQESRASLPAVGRGCQVSSLMVEGLCPARRPAQFPASPEHGGSRGAGWWGPGSRARAVGAKTDSVSFLTRSRSRRRRSGELEEGATDARPGPTGLPAVRRRRQAWCDALAGWSL